MLCPAEKRLYRMGTDQHDWMLDPGPRQASSSLGRIALFGGYKECSGTLVRSSILVPPAGSFVGRRKVQSCGWPHRGGRYLSGWAVTRLRRVDMNDHWSSGTYVVVLSSDLSLVGYVAGLLNGFAVVRRYSTTPPLSPTLLTPGSSTPKCSGQSRPPLALLVTEESAAEATEIPTNWQVNSSLQRMPVLLCGAFTSDLARRAKQLGDFLDDVIFCDCLSSGAAFRSRLLRATARRVGRVLARSLADPMPPDLGSLLDAIAEQTATTASVSTVSSMLRVSRRTILNCTRRYGWPPPSEIIVWSRLALYAHFLEFTSWPAERIALELEFPSLAAVSNALSRHVRRRPTALRSGGSFDCVLECFRERVIASRIDTTGSGGWNAS